MRKTLVVIEVEQQEGSDALMFGFRETFLSTCSDLNCTVVQRTPRSDTEEFPEAVYGAIERAREELQRDPSVTLCVYLLPRTMVIPLKEGSSGLLAMVSIIADPDKILSASIKTDAHPTIAEEAARKIIETAEILRDRLPTLDSVTNEEFQLTERLYETAKNGLQRARELRREHLAKIGRPFVEQRNLN